MKDTAEQKVGKQRAYCRKLGHFVAFSYCLQCGRENLPCSKVFDCWHRVFPVEAYIRSHYSEEEFQKILAPPPPRLTAILDLVAKLQRS
jgi:hypothetical protein